MLNSDREGKDYENNEETLSRAEKDNEQKIVNET